MVADKSKSDINLNDQLECGDSSKILSNLNTSSSDESTKCKSDDEFHVEHSLDSSTKDGSDDEFKNLNETYLCNDRSSDACDCSGDAKFEKVKKSLKLINSNSNGENKICSCSRFKTWKRRNVFNLSNHFKKNDRILDIYDIKPENLMIEDSMMVDDNKDESLLIRIRNYLAEYQELRGTSREEYTYPTLIRIMGQAIGHCLIALFHVILNIAPVLEIILHIIRFIFDKIIDIKKTADFQQVLFKTMIFLVEVLSIYICLIFIFGLIISPVIRMSFGIFSKIMLYD